MCVCVRMCVCMHVHMHVSTPKGIIITTVVQEKFTVNVKKFHSTTFSSSGVVDKNVKNAS